jgi:predicted AlkP superfamily pyrophosphatase or phosphodiesterase
MRNLIPTRMRWAGAAAGVSLALVAMASSVAGTAGAASPGAPPAAAPDSTVPTRVVFIVLDQLRPEFIEAFDMENVQALIDGGAHFERAYLGHMASETVISHNVMTSGQLPKNMGWSDEWYRDVEGVLGPENARYVTGSMSQDQFDDLIEHAGYPKLADYLHAEYPGSTVATVGSKNYAVYTMSGPGSDIRLTFGGREFDCDGTGVTWRGPVGVGVPAYIDEPVCNRFYVDADRSIHYGTLDTSPAWMYPVEGNRDVPGYDDAHLGGDIWITDAAFEIMDNEPDWSGMLLTYGGIDKAGHMWGGLNDVPPFPAGATDPMSHLPHLAKVADEQVGRVIDKLETDGLLDETLVVLTTDHAQLTSENYFGTDGLRRGNFNWYYGSDSDENYLSPQPEIQRLIDETDNVEMSMQDSAIRTWLVDRSLKAKKDAADVMATLGGVRASYFLMGDRYQLRSRVHKSDFAPREWEWFKEHAQEIVNTEAAPYAPDVIGLLADNTSYGVAGDHGGAQENVQRIPIVFYGAGVTPGGTPNQPMRSVDILPTILREMGIEPTYPMDGVSYRLP